MLPISRDEAIQLLEQYNTDRSDLNHYLESEAIMGALALRLGEDESTWRMLGLLHDIDWGMTKHDPVQHLTRAPEILRRAGFDDWFIETILSHGYGSECAGLREKRRTQKVEFALAAAETVTGLIYAYGLMRKTLEGMETKGLKKRMKEKKFAAGVNRDIIMESEQLGMSLDEFLDISIKAMQSIAPRIGF